MKTVIDNLLRLHVISTLLPHVQNRFSSPASFLELYVERCSNSKILRYLVLDYLEDVGLQIVLRLSGFPPDVVRGSKRRQLGLGGRRPFLSEGVNLHVLKRARTGRPQDTIQHDRQADGGVEFRE